MIVRIGHMYNIFGIAMANKVDVRESEEPSKRYETIVWLVGEEQYRKEKEKNEWKGKERKHRTINKKKKNKWQTKI